MTAGGDDVRRGDWVVKVAWATNVVFLLGTAGDAMGVSRLGGLATATSLVLFFVSLPVWLYALGKAFARSAGGDDITVASLFFLSGSASPRVRWHLLGACAVSVLIAAVIATENPAAVLVPMLPLGLAGLWGARYGVFPPRRDAPRYERR